MIRHSIQETKNRTKPPKSISLEAGVRELASNAYGSEMAPPWRLGAGQTGDGVGLPKEPRPAPRDRGATDRDGDRHTEDHGAGRPGSMADRQNNTRQPSPLDYLNSRSHSNFEHDFQTRSNVHSSSSYDLSRGPCTSWNTPPVPVITTM